MADDHAAPIAPIGRGGIAPLIELFNFSRRNQLALVRVVDDEDYDMQAGWWLSGRICGRLVSLFLPWRRRR